MVWEVFPEEFLESADGLCLNFQVWIDEQRHCVLTWECAIPEAVVCVGAGISLFCIGWGCQ